MKTQSKTATVERNTLESVFLAELTEVYHAQQRLGKIYKKMADAAHNEELKAALDNQVHNTALQVSRMDKCFEMLGLKADTVYADVVSGLIEAGEDAIDNFQAGNVRDTGLIAVAQKIEHYGISAYGTLRTIATLMGRVQCATLLEENKDEEAETDAALTRLAMSINQHALEDAKDC
jgi:ferritin-like metal-binding protein YciE